MQNKNAAQFDSSASALAALCNRCLLPLIGVFVAIAVIGLQNILDCRQADIALRGMLLFLFTLAAVTVSFILPESTSSKNLEPGDRARKNQENSGTLQQLTDHY